MLNINKVRKIVKGENGLSLPTNPYMSTSGLAFPLISGSASFSPEAQNIASQGMQRLQNNYLSELQSNQQKVASSTNPIKTSQNLIQDKYRQAEQQLSDQNTPKQMNLQIPNQLTTFANSLLQSSKDSYAGKYGGFTIAGDQLAQQGINFASSINPVLGLGLNMANLSGNILGKFGGSTDGETKVDSIFNTGLGTMLTFGLNGFLGKRTQNFSADNNTIAQVGGSYSGTVSDINEAAEGANKKYGWFSSGARRRMNRKIDLARTQQNKMQDIADEAADRSSISTNMSNLLHTKYGTALNGGYDQRYIKVSKHGSVLNRIKKLQLHKTGGVIKQSINVDTKQIEEWSPVITECYEEGGTIDWQPTIELFQEGGEVVPKITFESWYNMIPENKKDTTDYNLRRAFELAPQEELIKFAKDPESHLRTFYYNSDGVGEFMKSKNHPTLWMELEYYNNGNNVINQNGKNVIVPADKKEWEEFRKKYTLDTSGEYYKYIPNKFKNGGKTEELDAPKIEETTQKNIIPEGALHARKHNMDNAENLTKKGIPVIDNEGEQQAEIEKNEIIFTLEVTKKLEELMKDGSDKAAIEAGKLLVKEILFNTDDRTGLIGTLGKGGKIDVAS